MDLNWNIKHIVYKIFLLILLLGVHAEVQLLNPSISGKAIQISSAEFVIVFSVLFLLGYILLEHIKIDVILKEKGLFWILSFFCVSLLLSTIVAKYRIEAIKYDARIMATMLLFYLFLSFLVKEKLKVFSINVLIIVGIVVSFFGILQYLHIALVNKFLAYWDHGKGSNAATSFFQYKNVFGNYLVLLILITMGQLKEVNCRPYRILLGGLTGLFILTLGLSLSRSAWVAFTAAIGLYLWLKRRDRKIIKCATVVVVIFVVAIMSSTFARQRVFQTTDKLAKFELDWNVAARIGLWRIAFEMVKKHPVAGIGLNNYKDRSHAFANDELRKYTSKDFNAHNQYVNILAEQGILGFSMFMAFVAYLVRLAISNIKKGGNEFYALAIFAYLIGALFDYLWYDYSFIFMFWFVVILNVIENRSADPPAIARHERAGYAD